MSPSAEGIQTDDNGGVTEGVPGAVTERDKEVERSKSGKQGQLPNFPNVVEEHGTQKGIGHYGTARALPPAPP
jgi:hypothetical protein